MSTSTPEGPSAEPPVPAAAPSARLDEPRSLRLEDWLIVLTMAALALITFVNVVVRYFTDASFAWTEEISVFLMIVLAMVGGSAAVARQLHIRIEFFADGGSERRAKRRGSDRADLRDEVVNRFAGGSSGAGGGGRRWWHCDGDRQLQPARL